MASKSFGRFIQACLMLILLSQNCESVLRPRDVEGIHEEEFTPHSRPKVDIPHTVEKDGGKGGISKTYIYIIIVAVVLICAMSVVIYAHYWLSCHNLVEPSDVDSIEDGHEYRTHYEDDSSSLDSSVLDVSQNGNRNRQFYSPRTSDMTVFTVATDSENTGFDRNFHGWDYGSPNRNWQFESLGINNSMTAGPSVSRFNDDIDYYQNNHGREDEGHNLDQQHDVSASNNATVINVVGDSDCIDYHEVFYDVANESHEDRHVTRDNSLPTSSALPEPSTL